MTSPKWHAQNPLPFKGRARVGMGYTLPNAPPNPNPIPHPTSPLKGEEQNRPSATP